MGEYTETSTDCAPVNTLHLGAEQAPPLRVGAGVLQAQDGSREHETTYDYIDAAAADGARFHRLRMDELHPGADARDGWRTPDGTCGYIKHRLCGAHLQEFADGANQEAEEQHACTPAAAPFSKRFDS